MTALRDAAMKSKAWPFEEARALLKRAEAGAAKKGYVLFETGYGPSGLPHIGTFGEVARTTMIRRAFELISDIPTRLICFSDDLDGMRKVPDNVPQGDMLRENLQRPLTSVPDPFGEYETGDCSSQNRARPRLQVSVASARPAGRAGFGSSSLPGSRIRAWLLLAPTHSLSGWTASSEVACEVLAGETPSEFA